MASRQVIRVSALVIAVAGAAYLFVRAHLERGVVEVSHQAAVVAHELTTTTDSVSTSAVDQRYRVRRDAVASMRADLLRFVRAESMFIADSGVPRSTFLPGTPYDVRPTKGNLLEGLRITPTELTATNQEHDDDDHVLRECAVSRGHNQPSATRRPYFRPSPAGLYDTEIIRSYAGSLSRRNSS